MGILCRNVALVWRLFQPGMRNWPPQAALQYRDDVIRNARLEWGLSAPVADFAAQLHQESGWRPDAISPAGAQGLAQFMPATADWISQLIPMLSSREPFNPAWAIRALVSYDRWLWQRVSAASDCERMAMTLSGYNGGLGWVQRDRRLASQKGLDSTRWFGHVATVNAGRNAASWRENRHYPQRILRELAPRYLTWEAAVVWHLVKKLPWRGILLAILINAFLVGLYAMGYRSGHDSAKRDGDTALSQLQSAFDAYKTEQATLENAALRAWARRYQEQVAAGQRAEAGYLEQIAQLESRNKQLQGQINDVTQRWIDEKVRVIPLSACLLAVSCASTTPHSDMTTHPSTPVIQTQLPPLAPALAQRPGNLKPLTPGYAIRVSPSVTFSPTSSTTHGNVVAGGTR